MAALTLKTADAAGNPSTIHGRHSERVGMRPIKDYGKLSYSAFLVDLSVGYTTGGFVIDPGVLGFTKIVDMHVLGGKDPYGVLDVVHPGGITFELVTTDPTAPLLKLELLAAEAANLSTQAAKSVWIVLGGIR